MATVLEQLDAVPGFTAPVHRALSEPILLGGAPRSVAILNGTLAGAIGLGLQLWLAGILIWAVILRISLARRERAGLLTRKPFVSARYDAYAFILGIVLWGLFIWKLHVWLIGVPIQFAA